MREKRLAIRLKPGILLGFRGRTKRRTLYFRLMNTLLITDSVRADSFCATDISSVAILTAFRTF